MRPSCKKWKASDDEVIPNRRRNGDSLIRFDGYNKGVWMARVSHNSYSRHPMQSWGSEGPGGAGSKTAGNFGEAEI